MARSRLGRSLCHGYADLFQRITPHTGWRRVAHKRSSIKVLAPLSKVRQYGWFPLVFTPSCKLAGAGRLLAPSSLAENASTKAKPRAARSIDIGCYAEDAWKPASWTRAVASTLQCCHRHFMLSPEGLLKPPLIALAEFSARLRSIATIVITAGTSPGSTLNKPGRKCIRDSKMHARFWTCRRRIGQFHQCTN